MIIIFNYQDWWDAKLEAAGYGFWLSYVPKVLLAIVIAVMDEAYFKIAVWLNDLGKTFIIDVKINKIINRSLKELNLASVLEYLL